MIQIKNYINGNFTEPANGQYLDNVEPATGETYAQIPNSNAEDVEAAYHAAKSAFPGWAATPVGPALPEKGAQCKPRHCMYCGVAAALALQG